MGLQFRNDREIRAFKSKGAWYDVKDAYERNHIVRVGPIDASGQPKRVYAMRARFPGSRAPTRRKIADYGEISLREAREIVADWRRLVRAGVDPQEAQRREKATNDRQRRETFGAVVLEYLDKHVANHRSAAATEREIRAELLPAWREKPMAEITPVEVARLIGEVRDRPAPAYARNLLGHVRAIYNWAIASPEYAIDANPCDRISPVRLIGKKEHRQRVLSDDEIFAAERAAQRMGYPYGPLFRLLIRTGARKTEIGGARWSEFHPDLVRILRERPANAGPIDWRSIDPAWKVLTVPRERFKSDSAHIIPLSNDALAILEALPHFEGGDHLFSTSFGKKPVNGYSKAKVRLDERMLLTLRAMARRRGANPKKISLPRFVIHDFRRTVRTRLSALRISERVAEMILGHGKRGLARTYDQHEFLDEMREALELWPDRLQRIVYPSAGNVIAFNHEARSND